MRLRALLAAIIAGSIAVACSGDPLAPSSPETPEVALNSQGQGMVKAPVSGYWLPPHDRTPHEKLVVTPSGRCHGSGLTSVSRVTGDLEGVLTSVYMANNWPCNLVEPGSRVTNSGPVEGTLTYDGTTGPVTGQFNTLCQPGNTVVGISCEGTMTLRGHDALKGTQFHLDWGPGWWPFPYEGTAFSQ